MKHSIVFSVYSIHGNYVNLFLILIDTNGDEDIIDHDNVNSNSTFINPSQADKISKEEMFKCDMCHFASARICDIKDQKESDHNLCSKCISSFDNKKIYRTTSKKYIVKRRRLKGLTVKMRSSKSRRSLSQSL